MPLDAVILDMDGLMVDTEPLYKIAWQAGIAELGFELSDIALVHFREFLIRNPKGKNGVHYYTPEDFGLTREMINAEFKEYNEFLSTLQ